MKRVNILWLSLGSLFLIIFNLLFFMLGDVDNFNKSVWISYCFIHFAYFVLLLTPLLVRKRRVGINYHQPLYLITSVYFLTALLVGITFILIAPETVKVTIIIQAVVEALFLGWLLVYLIANEHTADNVELKESELQYIKESSAKLQSILQKITDKTTAKKVEQAYDLIHGSPTRSNADVHSLEQQVIGEIERLKSLVAGNETEQIVSTADKIYQLADDRNRQLKISNK